MVRGRFRQRALMLAMFAVVTVVVACGRASEQQIDQALGITPTPSPDASAIAQASADAELPVDGNLGIASAGRTPFMFNCQTCHAPGGGGSAPDLLASGGPGADLDYATLYPIVREGENHPPGPVPEFRITDGDISDIGAFIRENAAP